MSKLELNKTIEQLEKYSWSDIDFPTNLVKKCFELRKVKLMDLESEDLRLLVSQNIGLDYVIPLSLEKLSIDILEEGLFYPGDLVEAVLTRSCDYWRKNNELAIKLSLLVEINLNSILKSSKINEEIKNSIQINFSKFRDCIGNF